MTLSVLTTERAARVAQTYNQPEYALLDQIKRARQTKMAEMARFAELCDRWDNLYYPTDINRTAGPDHWSNHESAKIDGRVHISLNVYPAYVDIPASLQAVEPIENILPMDPQQESSRTLASNAERVYFSWKDLEDFELKAHQACVVKGLYGRTAGKIYWDPEKERPCFDVVDQPRNLWLGWARSSYRRLDWTLYTYTISPEEAIAEYGVDVYIEEIVENGKKIRVPVVSRSRSAMTEGRQITRQWLTDTTYMIECLDYWYRVPKPGATIELGKRTPMETRNAIFVGNVLVKDMAHPEYDGRMPYTVLFNTYIPGLPDGRSEFYDIEQLIREKEERLSEGGQLIHNAIEGQMFQLTGQDAPERVPHGTEPKPGKSTAPGPGNRWEKIEPFLPEFQLEQYLSRLDRELVDTSGLNDLLRGLAAGQVLSSSKAINALVANYEARIRLKRDVYYLWRKDTWELAKIVWGNKVPIMKAAFAMVGPLDQKPPSITPRDDLETATLATNLLAAKVWSEGRAMDYTGVDDPEGEKQMIREERTDASLFPADVQVQVALAAQMQQLQITASQMQMASGGAGPTPQEGAAQGRAAQMAAAGGRSAMGPSMNGTGEQPIVPPEGLPASGPGENFSAQTQIAGGEARNRLLLESPVAPEGGGGGGY